MKIQFTLNNKPQQAEFSPGETLFDFLRRNEVYSVKNGCDYGECGACTAIINGKAQNSCLVLMHKLVGSKVETVESFGKTNELHPLQQSFLDEGAIQCGYCTPAMILSTEALLRETKNPTEEQIRDSLAGNLCRCTGYVKPIKAVNHANR